MCILTSEIVVVNIRKDRFIDIPERGTQYISTFIKNIKNRLGCMSCSLYNKCRDGRRFRAYILSGSYFSRDLFACTMLCV